MIYYLGLRELPFKQERSSILYVENEYDEEVNRYIQENYTKIRACFEKHGYKFVYMPRYVEEVCSEEVVHYYAPYLTNIELPALHSNWILDFMAHPENRDTIKPSLLFYHPCCRKDDDTRIQYCGITIQDLDYASTDDFSVVLDAIALEIVKRKKKEEDIRFSIEPIEACVKYERNWDETRLSKTEEMEDVLVSFGDEDVCFERKTASECIVYPTTADDCFDTQSRDLLQEVAEKIALLRQMGISVAVLEQIIHKNEKLSRLLITKDNRIFLPDYDNMEIQMTPLHKAVFFLFLRHPEGIVFKDLPDHRDELYSIYYKLKDGLIPPRDRQSIDRIVDPLDNSINEKCARIREAFVSRFDERLASHYCIDGKRGEAKRIQLPHELIIWE